MKHYKKEYVKEFLYESNAIESEFSELALKDAESAWEFAFRHKHMFQLATVRGIHEELLFNLRPEIAGQLRNQAVYVGRRTCPFISERLLKIELNGVLLDIEKSIKSKDKYTEKKRDKITKDLHVRFEHVHPFLDGNGRVGRILYNIHRWNMDLPIHIIHAGVEQTEYYKWFRTKKEIENLINDVHRFLPSI